MILMKNSGWVSEKTCLVLEKMGADERLYYHTITRFDFAADVTPNYRELEEKTNAIYQNAISESLDKYKNSKNKNEA